MKKRSLDVSGVIGAVTGVALVILGTTASYAASKSEEKGDWNTSPRAGCSPASVERSETSSVPYDAESLYRALSVKEKGERVTRYKNRYEKEVGGLECIKNEDTRETTYSCRLNLESLDKAKIYEALNAEESPRAAERTIHRTAKSVGGIECIKDDHIRDGVSVTCRLNF